MPLLIDNAEADYLAHELARLTGEPIEQAVTKALQDRVERQRDIAVRIKRIEEIQRRVAALPVLDDRTADEILGYDENGLPT